MHDGWTKIPYRHLHDRTASQRWTAVTENINKRTAR
jgi:hypothetical protein